ncbi:bifunctional homocysteine S-methyltransferase/methylenetetrahydrofolate reductase [Dactylosporangium sp. CA-092794]|uniref:bifunctional homocysteine S-methyltransferase/methylenetetrahydrofolate reductase n=1 Tax=Dactylosporangium sp. CA-092794 TaxID=3239929 RepID=UPI003D93DFCA
MMLDERILVCDGATGTMLHAAGNALDKALPGLNLSHPDLVLAVHTGYVEAGVDILQTNTFAAGRLRLAEYGLAGECEAINRAAVRIAREAAETDRPVLVAGSVSPAVRAQQRNDVKPQERADALRQQIGTLAEAGVDLILLETFGYLDELVEAVEIAGELAGVPVIAQATFGNDYLTLCGHTPQQVVEALAGAPIAALGTNCVLGPMRTLRIVRELRRHTELPLSAQPNAGLPRRIAPARFEYDTDAEYFVRYARQLVEAGASVVGGCCGTTPSTIAAVVEAVYDLRRPARQGPPVTAVPRPRVAPALAPGRLEGSGRVVAVQLITPPVDGLDEVVGTVRDVVALGVDAVSITPSYSGRPRLTTVDVALHLRQQFGVEAMAGVMTWDRTGMVLQADLLGAHALGLRQIICETGSPPPFGDYPLTGGIWDLDSVGLIRLLHGLNEGRDYYGLAMPVRTEFDIGARINPGSHDPVREGRRALEKLEAGARFLVTRPVYERVGLERLLDVIGGRAPVLATIAPLPGFDQADFLAHEVPDVIIPAATLAALQRAGVGATAAGVEFAAELAAEVAPLVAGVVLAPVAEIVPSVRTLLDALGTSAE